MNGSHLENIQTNFGSWYIDKRLHTKYAKFGHGI